MSGRPFAGRRAFVTGGTEGIGRAVVEGWLRGGGSAWVVARDPAKLEERVRMWRGLAGDVARRAMSEQESAEGGSASDMSHSTPPGEVHGLSFDVRELGEASGRRRLEEFLSSGTLDLCVANVGTNIRKSAIEYDDHELDQVLDTNMRSAFALAQVVHPLLVAGAVTRAKNMTTGVVKGAHGVTGPDTFVAPPTSALVFVLSVAGHTHIGTGAPYAMSKAALAQLVKNLACEWAPDVRVNAVSPWYTDTPLARQVLCDAAYHQRVVARTPLGRVAHPDEVAAPILFLGSDPASFVSGQTLAVDGGYLANGAF